MSQQLITQPDIYDCEIEIVAEAYQLRDSAIKSAQAIETVTDAFEANQAAKAMDKLKDLKKGIESSRKQAKDPALQLGRRIDGIAKDFLSELDDELKRVQVVLGRFQAVEREKQREAERKAREERQDAIINGMKEGLPDECIDEQVAKIEAEVKESHSAVKGVRVRKTMHFEIKDEAELLKARPDLFSPDDSKIKAALRITKNIPGIEAWEETKAY